MEGLLAPTMVEKPIGKAEIRQVFKLSKAGTVAGCMVIEGVIKRSAGARLVRDGAVALAGQARRASSASRTTPRRSKKASSAVSPSRATQDFKEGDIIEAFEVEEVRQTL